MNTDNKYNSITAHMMWAKIVFGMAVLLVMLFLIIGEMVFPDERDNDKVSRNFQMFEAQWQQVLEDGNRIPVEVPGNIPAEYGEVITLVTTVPEDVYDGEIICFHVIWQDIDIYIDGELRLSYSTEDSRPFGINSAFRYLFVELREADAGKELTYQFSSNSKYAGNMRTCYIGDRMSVWLSFIEDAGMRAVMALFLLLMSLFCLLVCVILKWVYKKTLPLYYLAWTIFLCAFWMLSEAAFRQLVVKNISVLTNGTYWSLMLIPVSLMLYINDIQNGHYQKLFSIPIFYSTSVFVIGTILQIFDIMQFVQQLPFVHVGIITAIIMLIVTITMDAFKKRLVDYLPVGIGVYGMLVTAVLELVLYYVGTELSLGTVLVIGLMFLLIMAIIKTGQDLIHSEKKKQQAILAREAQAKFLANMSHEIRTPINAVIGMNEMILRENENDAIQEYAQNIKSASNMLLGLVNDILDFSKIESGQLELVEDTYSLASVIRDEVLLLNTRAAGKPISTKLDIDPALPSRFFGDELRIKQILTNLLSNAVKYTKEGSVTLKVFFQPMDDDSAKLCFSVSDTGVGIRQEDLSKLFVSFKRLELNKNRNIEGTGLGLNIAKQLVDLMKGDITVESEYGKGSTFTITIPQRVIDKQPIGNLEVVLRERKEETQKSEKFFTAPDAKILIVDDNAMNLSVMKGLLKRTQINIDLVSSGRECLEFTKHKQYDIILMDHMMPDLDGVKTLHMLRADNSNPNRNTIVIALTANAVAGCREMYLEYGFNDYISKPIQVEKLDELLIQHLPEGLVHMNEAQKINKPLTVEVPVYETQDTASDLSYIDRNMGLSYCMEEEELYQEVLSVFCEQSTEYLSQLEIQYTNGDWEQYAIIAHALKSSALNIGAANFSKLSLQHELAAKEEKSDFLMKEYSEYVAALTELIENVKRMLS